MVNDTGLHNISAQDSQSTVLISVSFRMYWQMIWRSSDIIPTSGSTPPLQLFLIFSFLFISRLQTNQASHLPLPGNVLPWAFSFSIETRWLVSLPDIYWGNFFIGVVWAYYKKLVGVGVWLGLAVIRQIGRCVGRCWDLEGGYEGAECSHALSTWNLIPTPFILSWWKAPGRASPSM